jgi:hypothetical protein
LPPVRTGASWLTMALGDPQIGHPLAMQRAVDWLFRNRRTGRITIVQFPNAALALFLVASVLGRLVHGNDALRVIATGALVWWAADEIVRGVNPWRRLLGGAVLAGQVVSLVS